MSDPRRRLMITVRGIVQGVGFRPFVYNTAVAHSLSGWVLNEADAVRIEVQGEGDSVDQFLTALRERHPAQARIDELEFVDLPAADIAADAVEFVIRESDQASRPRPTIPADLATCQDCQTEIRSDGERRCRYPFTNCTNCGPRWSIIERLPYDRSRTSMRHFAMCDACRREYEAPTDRRFHAQPIACPDCGPRLELLDGNGASVARHDAALGEACRVLMTGGIVAMKGLGGFQLIVDATDQAAVQRLRDRKRRPDKPFALLVQDLTMASTCCAVSDDEATVLESHQAPILLLHGRNRSQRERPVADAVAPGNPYLGVMLPCSPLHHLLIRAIDRPLVCTSGNLSEEPMAISTAEAVSRLGSIADVILTHNRPIVRPVDDSVARVGATGLQLIRRARGYAPLPIRVGRPLPTILAVGGHLKNTVAISLGREVILTPHIGDLDSSLSIEVHRRAVEDLVSFFDVQPEAIACDLHPDYASTRLAERLATQWRIPLIRTQHHHAHVAACRAENEVEGPLLGFSWDGTGYGTDGTVWGGEVLLCRGGDFQRVAHLKPFGLPGGDRAAREPRRSGLGLLYELMGHDCRGPAATWFQPAELELLVQAMDRPHLFPRTSSMGRLFDAAAVICGLSDRVSFEGQAAMALEFAVDDNVKDAYPLATSDGSLVALDWRPMLTAMLQDLTRGEPLGTVAARFHNTLAEMAVVVAERAGCPQIALTGGCFQNEVLTRQVGSRLSESGFTVYTHHHVPPGDGGIALGQILIAAERIGRT